MQLIDFYFTALKLSAVAIVYCCILLQPGELLSSHGQWLVKLSEKYPNLVKPLGLCAKCFAGQLSFWYHVLTQPFNFTELVMFTCTTIVLTIITTNYYERH